MITAIQTASKLDWSGWIRGVLGAFISGGAGAIATAGGGTWIGVKDPDHFMLKGHHLLELMGATFVISALVSLAKFLQLNPVPTVIVQTPGAGPVNVTVNQPKP